jgi:hypothetical protein
MGCSPERRKTDDEIMESFRVNKNAGQIAFPNVPPEFKKVSDTLYGKKLNSPKQNEMRFERVMDSGIKFKNTLARHRTFRYIETGAGVAMGDYDGDGLVDIYFLGSDVPNKLYRGLGNFKFEDVTHSAGVEGLVQGKATWASGATFADVDNDGDLDLFVANLAAPSLMYINQGDGTFLEQGLARKVGYVGAGKVGNFCDYDRDGDLDFYLLTYQDIFPEDEIFETGPDGKRRTRAGFEEYWQVQEVTIPTGDKDRPFVTKQVEVRAGEKDILFRNDGNGVFEDVSASAGIGGFAPGLSATWMDVDNDGWMDLYVGIDYGLPDHLYRNNQNGTFTDVLGDYLNHTPMFSMGADSGDLNNDGLVDFMIADMAGTTHFSQKLRMGGMENLADFLEWGHPRQCMRNSLYINSGVGRFFDVASMAHMSRTDWTWATRFADLDNDGLLDVFVTNGHARDSSNADIVDDFTEAHARNATPDEIHMIYENIPELKTENLAYRNKGGLEFESIGADWNLNHNGVSHGAAFADIDADGDLDIVVNNYYEEALVYRNNSSEGSRVTIELQAKQNNRFGFGSKVEVWSGDYYAQRYLNPTRGYVSSDNPGVHFGLGDIAKLDRVKITWPDGTAQELTDLETNMSYLIVESVNRAQSPIPKTEQTLFVDVSKASGLDFKHKDVRFNDYDREPLLPLRMSELGCGVVWGDVNGDAEPDLFCGGAAGQSGELFVNKDGSFKKVDGPWREHKDREDSACLFFDADGDGDQDLYVGSGSNEWNEGDIEYLDRLYLNDEGQFSLAEDGTIPDHRESTGCVAAADYDGDGDLDLFVGSRSIPGRYPVTPTSHLLINDGGKFSEASPGIAEGLSGIGLVTAATWVDYNGDGADDLIVALEWGPMTIFENVDGKLTNKTESLGLGGHLGWWHGVSMADLDGDGDLDFVATNQGRNTKYHADFEHPHRIYYDDIDGNGTCDLVEAEFEGDVEYPVRGRSCSSHAMPFIKDKFKSYREFAGASLLEIYEPKMKERPKREVNFLDSAVFWNDGDKFRIESLPYLAQISPSYGVLAKDFDQDGHVDIMMTNNFFSSQPETGYMDGGMGWFLRGNGEGKFEPVWPNKSGVVLPFDSGVAGVVDYDKDGDLDVVVGVSNGNVQLLQNQSQR